MQKQPACTSEHLACPVRLFYSIAVSRSYHIVICLESVTYRSDGFAALALECSIISFLSSVPGPVPEVRREDESSILSVRTLAYAAMIQLQQDSCQRQTVPSEKALMAAMDAAALLLTHDCLLQEVSFVDPILSVCAESLRPPPLSLLASRSSGAMSSRS